jgi:hypothetical protein
MPTPWNDPAFIYLQTPAGPLTCRCGPALSARPKQMSTRVARMHHDSAAKPSVIKDKVTPTSPIGGISFSYARMLVYGVLFVSSCDTHGVPAVPQGFFGNSWSTLPIAIASWDPPRPETRLSFASRTGLKGWFASPRKAFMLYESGAVVVRDTGLVPPPPTDLNNNKDEPMSG